MFTRWPSERPSGRGHVPTSQTGVRRGEPPWAPNQQHERTKLRKNTLNKNLNTNAWKIFAVFNHDLQQVFVGASDAPMHQMGRECDAVARTLANWQCTTHNIEHIEAVESFPTHRHAQMYATWLKREGAFEGTEHYGMGVQASLVSAA